MRITRCLFGIGLKAINAELLRRADRHQVELTELSNRLPPVLSSNARLRQALATLNPEIAAFDEIGTESNALIKHENTFLAPRGGRRHRGAQPPRALWGLPVREVARIFAEQEHRLVNDLNRVQSQLNLALAEHLSLRQELDLLRQRLAAEDQPPQAHAAPPREVHSARSRVNLPDMSLSLALLPQMR